MMAVVETRDGVRSTYYLLPPAAGENYFGYIDNGQLHINPEILDAAQYMQDLGHEVGLHNDLISVSLLNNVPAEKYLGQILSIFSKNGMRIISSASHGNPACRIFGYVNKEIFAECWTGTPILTGTQPCDAVALFFGSLFMRAYGLENEANHIAYDAYYTDSGCKNTFTINRTQKELHKDTTNFFTEGLLNINVAIVLAQQR